jgi:hypothetical protein
MSGGRIRSSGAGIGDMPSSISPEAACGARHEADAECDWRVSQAVGWQVSSGFQSANMPDGL